MVRNKVIASVCSALVVTGAGLLNAQADVTAPPPGADFMMVPPHDFAHGPVYCIDGVCTPLRITNGFHPTRWRKWPISPPAAAPRGAREGISPPTLDVPGPDVEAEIPGRAGMPLGEPRSEPPTGAPDTTEPDLGDPGAERGRREPSTSPTLPVEPREPEMPPELTPDDYRGRSQPPERGRLPQLQRDDRSPRRMPPVATRMLNRQASLVETLRGETTDATQESTSDELPSVRFQPKTASRLTEDSHPSAATPSPAPFQGTRAPRTTPFDNRPPAEQPRAGSAFHGKSGTHSAVGGRARQVSAIMTDGDNRVAQASAATIAVRPKITDSWESELVPANPLRSRDSGGQRRFDVVQTSASKFDSNDEDAVVAMPLAEPASRTSPAAPERRDLAAEAYTGLPFRNPLRK
jgi:hypothetical protein